MASAIRPELARRLSALPTRLNNPPSEYVNDPVVHARNKLAPVIFRPHLQQGLVLLKPHTLRHYDYHDQVPILCAR